MARLGEGRPQPLDHSVKVPIATGWSDSCRVGFTPTGRACLCAAHRSFRVISGAYVPRVPNCVGSETPPFAVRAAARLRCVFRRGSPMPGEVDPHFVVGKDRAPFRALVEHAATCRALTSEWTAWMSRPRRCAISRLVRPSAAVIALRISSRLAVSALQSSSAEAKEMRPRPLLCRFAGARGGGHRDRQRAYFKNHGFHAATS